MGSHSQGNLLARRVLAELVPIAAVAALFAVAVVLAWRLITAAPPPRQSTKPPSEPPFLSVAGAAVDIEVVAPDGRRTNTLNLPDSSMKIAGSEGRVECNNYGDPHATESNCTASVVIRQPANGEYRIEATSPERRSETLNVGWGGAGFKRAGGFDVHVSVDPRSPSWFTIVVSSEGVWLRGQARP